MYLDVIPKSGFVHYFTETDTEISIIQNLKVNAFKAPDASIIIPNAYSLRDRRMKCC